MNAALESAANDAAVVAPQATHRATLLHLLTCGSVDDGKSTLLGRLLYESKAVPDDQLSALDRDSRRYGTQGEARDFALLIDGLTAEREQGITIDVAYRYFSTSRRAFIVADTPGHEQYTRNMATGASTAELAIILVDARKGILPQTRRHSYIVSMLGVRHVVLSINKMDLVDFAEETFREIDTAYRRAVEPLGFASIVAIPLCARAGDNVATRSSRTAWYSGPPLLEYLEGVVISPLADAHPGFRMPVQWVNRPDPNFRGYAGTIASGIVHAGQPVLILPGGARSRIDRIVTADGDLAAAVAGQPVTVTLADEVDVSRGDVIVPVSDPLPARTKVTARVLWMQPGKLTKGQSLLIKLASATANARMTALAHAIDIHDFTPRSADSLAMNEIGVVELTFDRPLVAGEYSVNRELGAFILINRMTNQTVGLGVIEPEMSMTPRKAFIRRLGVTEALQSHALLPGIVRRLAGAFALAVLVLALSGDRMVACAVAAGEVILCPVLNRLLDLIWSTVASSDQPPQRSMSSDWV